MADDAMTDEWITLGQAEEIIGDKITKAKRGGGYIYHSDHSVAPDVPFEKYQMTLEIVRRYLPY